MSENTTEQPKQPETTQSAPAEAVPKGKSGETAEQTIAGLREALKAANKEAEQSRVKARDEFRTQMRDIFGEQPEGAKPEDAVKALQLQMTAMQHDNLVLRLASENGITNADDLGLLGNVTDPNAMKVLAARLAPPAPDPTASQPRPPRADFSQALNTTTALTPAQEWQDFLTQALKRG